MPEALVALAFGQQPHAHHVVRQFESEARDGLLHLAQLFPRRAVGRLGFAQLGEQAAAEFVNGKGLLFGPGIEQVVRRRAAQQIKRVSHQRQGRPPGKELHLAQGMRPAGRQRQMMGERKMALHLFQARLQLRQIAAKDDRLAGRAEEEPGFVAPLHQPLQQFQPCQDHGCSTGPPGRRGFPPAIG